FKTKGKGAPTQNITLYVPQNPSKMADFQLFNDRVTGEKYSLNDDGVIINEKLAKLFGYKVGDQLNLENSDNQTYHVKIAAIAENYTGHFVYMTPKLYQTMTKQKPEYNTEFLLFDKKLSSKQETSIGEALTKQPKVLNITFLTAMKGSFDDMLKSLDIVIWVLIAVSGSLALIVLYNLTNINVSERIRELSTIKVLGFYDREVTTYVYRENIILTFIGIIVGCFFGKILHQYILATVEVDLIMFSPIIHWPSYLYSAVITMCFTLFVMVIMHRKLKKINMIEALKSNE
ncbi:MAG: ABC transporter permease, partial [Enterococcus faecalis]|nr:ABC transporter permease [Enterococcus faecalis]